MDFKKIIFLLIFFIIILSNIFLLNGENDLNIKKNSTIDKIYYSFITATTVGFGDITPTSKKAKIINIISNFILFFLPFILLNDTIQFQKISFHLICIMMMIIIYNIANLGYKLTFLDSIYNVFINHFTIGYGDFLPTTNIGKFIVISHVLIVYLFNIIM